MFSLTVFLLDLLRGKQVICIPKPIVYTFYCIVVISLVIFIGLQSIIIYNANNKPPKNAEYIIVLGAKVNGEVPSYTLSKRIDNAYIYLINNPDTKAILSGGKGNDENISEAQAMYNELDKRGISKDRLIIEDKSKNTMENINNSKELMEDSNSQVVIVTTDFHVFRAVTMAKESGFNNVYGYGAKSLYWLIPNDYVRESLAIIKYYIMFW